MGRLAKTVTVVFDGDTAGQRAAQKAIPLFVDADIDGRIARLPAGVDPDDFVRRPSAARTPSGAWSRARGRCSTSSSRTRRRTRAFPTGSRRCETITALLVKVKDQTTRELYAEQLAGVLGWSRSRCGARCRRPPRRRSGRRASTNRRAGRRRPRQTGAAAAPATGTAARLPGEELELLALLATHPELLRTPEAQRARATCWSTRWPASSTGPPPSRPRETGNLDVPAWLETRRVADRADDRDGARWTNGSPSSPIPRGTCANW